MSDQKSANYRVFGREHRNRVGFTRLGKSFRVNRGNARAALNDVFTS